MPPSSDGHTMLAPLVLVASVAMGVYLNSLTGDFCFDDNFAVVGWKAVCSAPLP